MINAGIDTASVRCAGSILFSYSGIYTLILINANRSRQNLSADSNRKIFSGTVGPLNQGKAVFLNLNAGYASGMNAAARVKKWCC